MTVDLKLLDIFCEKSAGKFFALECLLNCCAIKLPQRQNGLLSSEMTDFDGFALASIRFALSC